MANENIKSLVDVAYLNLKQSFENSKLLFKDNKRLNNLFHAAEYGAYRERLVHDYLSLILPRKFGIGTGFIINHKNEISPQCDVIIYDKNKTPLFDTKTNARFFPVETVVGIIEVKSTLSTKNLNEAIKKNQNIKLRRLSLCAPNSTAQDPLRINNADNYNPNNPTQQFCSVIICEKFNFDINGKLNDIELPQENKTFANNLIFSLGDGLILYRDHRVQQLFPWYSFGDNTLELEFVHNSNNAHNLFRVMPRLEWVITN